MASRHPDDQLDRLLERYLAVRGEVLEHRAIPAREALARAEASGVRPWRALVPALVTVVMLCLLGLLIVGAAVVLGPSPDSVHIVRGLSLPTGPMSVAREAPTMTLLDDGRVLVVGGWIDRTTAEVWNPATGSFTAAGRLSAGREGQTATLLRDGRVLVAGGIGTANDNPTLASAEIWDPATGAFAPTAPLMVGRHGAQTRLLDDGRVLFLGGMTGSGDRAPAESGDPGTGGTLTDDGGGPLVAPVGTLLRDGRVLVIGGARASLWDPETGTMSPAGALQVRRAGGWSATLLADGRVLVAGGERDRTHRLDAVEVWDPSDLSTTVTAPLVHPRGRHSAVLLADGRVLIAGDRSQVMNPGLVDPVGSTAEVYELDPG